MVRSRHGTYASLAYGLRQGDGTLVGCCVFEGIPDGTFFGPKLSI